MKQKTHMTNVLATILLVLVVLGLTAAIVSLIVS